MRAGLVWAQSTSGVIGRGGDIPWRVPEDLAHFKKVTMGHTVVMGRRTWDSLPASVRPLPGRRNIVLSRQVDFAAEGAEVVGSLDEALSEPGAWVIGGGQIYFLSDPAWAMPSIVVMSMWRNLGYFMIIVLAALKSVPSELLEAAKIDGANAVQRFWSISLPTIKGVVAFVAITWFLGALQMFTQSYVMTGGGPVNATRTIVYLMYDEAFTNLSIGKACAMAVMLFLLVVALSLILRVILRPKGQV